MQSINDHAAIGVKKILVANKSDKLQDREITREEGESEAGKFGINYFETSALNGDGVKESINNIIDQCIDSILEKTALAHSQQSNTGFQSHFQQQNQIRSSLEQSSLQNFSNNNNENMRESIMLNAKDHKLADKRSFKQ